MYFSPFTSIKLSLYPAQSEFIKTYFFTKSITSYSYPHYHQFLSSSLSWIYSLLSPFHQAFDVPTPPEPCLLEHQ